MRVLGGLISLILVASLLAGCITDGDPEGRGGAEPDGVDFEPRGPTGARVDLDGLDHSDGSMEILGRLLNATGTYYYIGASTFEPTIGTTSTGGVFMNSYAGLGSGQLIMRSMDQGQSWEDVTPRLPTGTKLVPNSNDPFMYVDPFTDRIYEFDMCITLQGFCIAYSDDDGESWTHLPPATGWSVVLDHQSIAAAPHRDGPEPTLYENILVFCVNRLIGAWCSTSYDGGLMWTPMVPGHPVETPQCTALHAHVTGSPDGRFYRGNPSCSGPAVYRSEDGGLTWTEHTITTEIGTQSGINSHEIATATDDAGNLYAFWIGNDGLPYLVYSLDYGDTWSVPRMVGAPGVTASGFPTIAGGAEGRVAWAYIGTDVEDGYSGDDEQMEWTGYIGFSLDILSNGTIAHVPVNAPDDPLDEGHACGRYRCGAFGDFIDIVIDHEGRPWAAMGHNGYGSGTTGRAGVAATLATGPSLRHDGDLPELPLGGPDTIDHT